MSNYSVFMKQIVDMVNDLKNEAGKTKSTAPEEEKNRIIDLQTRNLEMQANAYCLFVRDEVKRDPKFDESLAYEWKNAKAAVEYVTGKAKEMYISGSNAPVMVPENIVYEWLKEYYAIDDKEEFYKKKAEEEERKRLEAEKKAKAEEAARKKQEKYEKIMAKPEEKRTKTDLEFLKKYKPVKAVSEDDEEVEDEDICEDDPDALEAENEADTEGVSSKDSASEPQSLEEESESALCEEPASEESKDSSGVDDSFWENLNFDSQGQACFLTA